MIVVASSKVDSDVIIVMVVFRLSHAEATFMMVWYWTLSLSEKRRPEVVVVGLLS
jgi:hypothetical protein